jgi:hypothetical protein
MMEMKIVMRIVMKKMENCELNNVINLDEENQKKIWNEAENGMENYNSENETEFQVEESTKNHYVKVYNSKMFKMQIFFHH